MRLGTLAVGWIAALAAACGPDEGGPQAALAPRVQLQFLTSGSACGRPAAEPTPPGLPPADAAELRLSILDQTGRIMRRAKYDVDAGAQCRDSEGRQFACPFDTDDDALRERQVVMEGIPAGRGLLIRAEIVDDVGIVQWSGRRADVVLAADSQVLVRMLLTRHGAATCVGRTSSRRAFATATLLLDGRVLVAGGFSRQEGPCGPGCVTLRATNSVDVYDPRNGTFHPVEGGMAEARGFHSATRTSDGRVVIVGGAGRARVALGADDVPLTFDEPADALGPRATFEVFDPASGTFTGVGPLNVARVLGSVVARDDGTVLAVGGGATQDFGAAPFDPALKSSEIIDPDSVGADAGPRDVGPQTASGRRGGTAVWVNRGSAADVLAIIGGASDPGRSVELLSDGEFVAPTESVWESLGVGGAALPNLLLPIVRPFGDGKAVLLTGGPVVEPRPTENRWVARWRDGVAALRLSVSDGTTTSVLGLVGGRLYSSGEPLPDGRVAILGGLVRVLGSTGLKTEVRTSLIGSTGRPVAGPRLAVARAGHTSVALQDGTILTIGGFATGGDGLLRASDRMIHDTAEVLNAGGTE